MYRDLLLLMKYCDQIFDQIQAWFIIRLTIVPIKWAPQLHGIQYDNTHEHTRSK